MATPVQNIPLNVADVRPAYPARAMPIPNTPPAQSAYPGTASTANTVSGISGVPLGQVGADATRWSYPTSAGPPGPPNHFVDAILPRYSNREYTPTLRDSLGATIPYRPSVWEIEDTENGVVHFLTGTPATLGYTPPLTIDYWRYTGPFL